jgi:hypothetical protein
MAGELTEVDNTNIIILISISIITEIIMGRRFLLKGAGHFLLLLIHGNPGSTDKYNVLTIMP